MNYDKLSRSLRYYYEKGIMQKGKNLQWHSHINTHQLNEIHFQLPVNVTSTNLSAVPKHYSIWHTIHPTQNATDPHPRNTSIQTIKIPIKLKTFSIINKKEEINTLINKLINIFTHQMQTSRARVLITKCQKFCL